MSDEYPAALVCLPRNRPPSHSTNNIRSGHAKSARNFRPSSLANANSRTGSGNPTARMSRRRWSSKHWQAALANPHPRHITGGFFGLAGFLGTYSAPMSVTAAMKAMERMRTITRFGVHT